MIGLLYGFGGVAFCLGLMAVMDYFFGEGLNRGWDTEGFIDGLAEGVAFLAVIAVLFLLFGWILYI